MDAMRTGEAARRLSVSDDTIRRYIARGVLKAVRLPGGEYRIPVAELDRLLTPVAVAAE